MNYDTHFKQIILGNLASASQVSSGMTLSFPAVALYAMNATCSLTSNQEFWIVGLPQISMVIGCISAGPILDFQGRRFSLLLANLISLAGWFLMAAVPDLWSILISRFLTGFAMGFVNPVVLVYVSEIASPDIRSGLTVANSITFSVGVTLTFLFGYFFRVEWRTVSWLCGLFPTACFILMFFVLPEPKLWRGKITINKAKFKRPEVYKPMIIMLIALFFRQMNGSSVILSYTVAASIAAVNIFLTGFLAIWVHQWLRSDSFIMFTYYGFVGFASTLYLFLFLPETHGKTLKEIEMIFNKNLIDDEMALPINSSNPANTNYTNKT